MKMTLDNTQIPPNPDAPEVEIGIQILRDYRKQITPEWPEPMVKDLIRLWSEGLSARQIGMTIHKTRNAVIGKARRLALEPRKPTNQHSRETDPEKRHPSPRMRKRIKPPQLQLVESVPLAHPGPEPISLLELTPRSCRAIVGSDPGNGLALYCGHLTFWDDVIQRFRPFCEQHAAIYYDRRRTAIRGKV